jgi:hypothetical protein
VTEATITLDDHTPPTPRFDAPYLVEERKQIDDAEVRLYGATRALVDAGLRSHPRHTSIEERLKRAWQRMSAGAPEDPEMPI